MKVSATDFVPFYLLCIHWRWCVGCGCVPWFVSVVLAGVARAILVLSISVPVCVCL